MDDTARVREFLTGLARLTKKYGLKVEDGVYLDDVGDPVGIARELIYCDDSGQYSAVMVAGGSEVLGEAPRLGKTD